MSTQLSTSHPWKCVTASFNNVCTNATKNTYFASAHEQYTSMARQSRILAVNYKRKLDTWASDHPYQAGILSGVAALAVIGLATMIIRKGWVRVKTADDLTGSMFARRRKLHGLVVRVGDGDNFRLLHQPFFKRYNLSGLSREQLKANNTIHVRLAGVDAPECAHFGAVGQKHGPEALEWLKNKLTNKHVTIQIFQRDQYQRVVAAVKYKPGWFRPTEDISMELVKAGYGVVYKGAGAQYNGALARLEAAQKLAQQKRVGMWCDGVESFVSPGEYKKALKQGMSLLGGAAQATKGIPETEGQRAPSLIQSALRQGLLWLSDSSRNV